MRIRVIILIFLVSLFFLINDIHVTSGQDTFKIYPVQGIFLSEKTVSNNSFMKAMSINGDSKDRIFGINTVISKFKEYFSELASNINDSNKYSTFVAYLEIPRVSKYRIDKSEKLVDFYLPVTGSLNILNILSGELLYSNTYTYYAKYETVKNTSGKIDNLEKTSIDLYRDTFKLLVDKIVSETKGQFKPFTISATIKQEWNDNLIIDKGMEKGIAKGDILIDQYGNQISIIHSSFKYSVAQKLLGDRKADSIFSKYSNKSIDEIKKPKVLILPPTQKEFVLPDSVIYQLFINALGKRSAFSLISIDKSFYKVQRSVIQATNIKQEVTQKREIPDLFMRLFFYSPFYIKFPTNKPYLSVDNYAIITCGEMLDKNGRVLYGQCVDDKISDEVYGNIRYSNEAREEVLIKNSLLKLASDFNDNIKFNKVEIPISETDNNTVIIKYSSNLLSVGSSFNIFYKLGKVDGIEEEVYVPIWEASVFMKEGEKAFAQKILPLSSKSPMPTLNDKIFITNLSKQSDNSKIIKLCKKNYSIEGNYKLEDFLKLSQFFIAGSLKYPYIYGQDFQDQIIKLNDGAYGFKSKIEPQDIATAYCVEPVLKIQKELIKADTVISTNKIIITAGLRLYFKDTVIWKKGMQQEITIHSPNQFEKEVLDFEITKAMSHLYKNIAIQANIQK